MLHNKLPLAFVLILFCCAASLAMDQKEGTLSSSNTLAMTDSEILHQHNEQLRERLAQDSCERIDAFREAEKHIAVAEARFQERLNKIASAHSEEVHKLKEQLDTQEDLLRASRRALADLQSKTMTDKFDKDSRFHDELCKKDKEIIVLKCENESLASKAKRLEEDLASERKNSKSWENSTKEIQAKFLKDFEEAHVQLRRANEKSYERKERIKELEKELERARQGSLKDYQALVLKYEETLTFLRNHAIKTH
jgi:hypothetical protein